MEDKLVSKISKLLALGNGTSFDGEAEASIQKAYSLMREHNITMAQIESANREEELGPLGEHSVIRFPKTNWEQMLFYYVAKLFDCSTFINNSYIGNNRKQKTYIIVGREGNRVTSELMYKWLRSKIESDSYIHATSYSGRLSYSLGCVYAISDKVNSLKKEEPSTDAWGIVPADEVDDYLRRKYPNLRSKGGSVHIGDARAYYQGRSDGSNISLNRQFAQHAIADR